jgi:hypothetical protein
LKQLYAFRVGLNIFNQTIELFRKDRLLTDEERQNSDRLPDLRTKENSKVKLLIQFRTQLVPSIELDFDPTSLQLFALLNGTKFAAHWQRFKLICSLL